MRASKRGILTTAAVAGLLLAATPGVAVAAPTTDELVKSVTPDGATQLDIAESNTAERRAGNNDASAENNDGVGLVLSDSTGEYSVPVTVGDATSLSTESADASSPVGEDSSGSPIYVQQLNDHQQRVVTSIDDPDDANTFRYDFDLGPDQSLEVTEDGTPFVYEQDGDEYIIVTVFSVPWAKDAEGRDLATSYSIEGEAVVQTVDVADASFPVVADPTWTVGGAKAVVPSVRGGAADIYLNKKFSKDFTTVNNFACGSVAAVIGLAGTPLAGVGAGVICGAAAAAWSIALNHNQCAVLTLRTTVPPQLIGTAYSGSWCK